MASDITKGDAIPLAIVTGAARRIGRAIALHLAGRGYSVALHYHRAKAEAEETAAEIEQLRAPVYLVQADLTQPDEISAMFSIIDKIPGQLELLVNSAALMIPSDLMAINANMWDNLFNLNARAAWLCSREAALRMKSGGLILNISDVGASKNWTRYGGYVISKVAVESLTRLLARQLAPGVRVCAVSPGLLLKADDQNDEEWDRLVAKVPLDRPAEMAELLSLLDFLISNEYITGEVISLSGGYQLV